MKKIIFLFVVIAGGFYYFNSINNKGEVEVLKEVKSVLVNKEKLLETEKSVKNKESEAFTEKENKDKSILRASKEKKYNQKNEHITNDLKDYQKNLEELLNQYDRKNLIGEIISLSEQTLRCLKKDLCGIERDEDHPYFAENQTPAHSLLEHQLSLLIQLKERRQIDLDEVPGEFLNQAMELPNESIQLQAIELKIAQDLNDKTYSNLLDKAKNFKPKASASLMAQLSNFSNKSPKQRRKFSQALYGLVQSPDQAQAVELAQRFKYLDLKENEITALSKNVCHLSAHNKKAVAYHLKIEAEGTGEKLNLDCHHF